MNRYFANALIGLGVAGLAATGVGLASASPAGADSSLVHTDNGPVRGIVGQDYHSFQGIPYAAPPVGELRWRSPQPAARWTVPRDATKPGNACPQNAGLIGDEASDTEDCLYLNVTTPRRGRALPVMVFIHGNGFVNGQGALYGGRPLAVGGDVVVVTVNYRLNVFGFLANPALDDGTHKSGNFGLEDQQAALRWVQRNAAAFGGDPRNVTVFGESAGGISTCAQVLSPGAAGLFQHAIIQSGACTMQRTYLNDWGLHTRSTANERGNSLAQQQGCTDPATVAQCLRGKSVAELLDMPDFGFGFGPVYGDNAVLPLSPTDALRTGRFNKVPVMQGTTHDEHRTFTAGLELITGHVLQPDEYATEVTKNFGDRAAQVLARYPLGTANPSVTLASVATDSSWGCQAYRTDQLLSRQVPTFAYEFTDEQAPWFHDTPAPSFPTGAFHASELQFLFDGGYGGGTLTPAEQRLAQRMITYWTTFARTGNPNGAGLPHWPGFGNRALSLAPDSIKPVDFNAEHHCDFWKTIGQ
jgi:para-nitrobenzyl esterase